MKIGAFAKHFDVSIETVRYYMGLGLLIPEKKETQYRFNDMCIDDMEWIMELKQLRFSLTDIQRLLSFKRISQFADDEDRDYLAALLGEKKESLLEERAQLDRTIGMIEEKIRWTRRLSQPGNATGVPLGFIPLLACPDCSLALPVANAFIQEQHLLEARLHCGCGYHAEVKDGILITPSSLVSDKQDYFIYDQDVFQQLTPSWISLMEKGSLWIFNMLTHNAAAPQVVLQTNVDVYVFPPKYLASLPQDNLYVFSANSLMMLKKLKGKVEHLNPKLNVLYVVNSDLRLPLRKGMIDLVIDTLSFVDFSLYSTTYPLQRLQSYLKADAAILGTYLYYHEKARSLENLRRLYEDAHPQNFEEDYMANQLATYGFQQTGQEYMGYTTDPGRYLDYHLENERLHLAAYQARRTDIGKAAIPMKNTGRFS